MSTEQFITIDANDVYLYQTSAVSNYTINVILLGGNLNLQYQFTFGKDTIAQLQNYRADKMIIAADGVSINHGLTTYHYQEVDVSCQMMDRANEVIAVVDYSKIGKEGFAYIAPLDSIDILITNLDSDNVQELDAIRREEINVKQA